MKIFFAIISLAAIILMGLFLSRPEKSSPEWSAPPSPIFFTYWHSIEHLPNYHHRELALFEDGSFYYWQSSHIPRFVGDRDLSYDARGTYQEDSKSLILETDFGPLTLHKETPGPSSFLRKPSDPSDEHSPEVLGWVLQQGDFRRRGNLATSGLPESWFKRPIIAHDPPPSRDSPAE